MNIQGLQKLTLLDFPGKMACTIFTAGCDLRCPFCHNRSLVINPPAESVVSMFYNVVTPRFFLFSKNARVYSRE